MSLLSNGNCNQSLGNIPISKTVQERVYDDDTDADSPLETRRTSCNITKLPDDCLNIIFNCLTTLDHKSTRDDSNSSGLTCRQWLHIQNGNCKVLKLADPKNESFAVVLFKLLGRFQYLKHLFLKSDIPEITAFLISKPPCFESKVQHLNLDHCYKNSDSEFSSMFSCFPHLTSISLGSIHSLSLGSFYITDKGLEALAKCCSFLEEVRLSGCESITDSGIRFLLQNCRKLHSLCIRSCGKITGIGFLECPKTLTRFEASMCKLKPEGIKAVVSGGGLEHLSFYEFSKAGEGSINTQAVVTISKGCPLLKKLCLRNCKDVELEGWEAIGRNCKNLEILGVRRCRKLCDEGLQALGNGCNKLYELWLDTEQSYSSFAIELFKREKPQCYIHFYILS
ncbi:F-box/LRR-repeat protein 12-like [Papaver somniferum]|uniref:F-box/LRR-repeat protein 12-like n=1 Tax=Papaver somniferum TaxID=3469 RepID=UPI000E700F9C|nr:F-box/LRR-repeat protein 12-like [Papaver somniferum]